MLSTFTEESTPPSQTKPAQSHRVLVACPTHTTMGTISVCNVSASVGERGSVYFWPSLTFCLATFFSLLCFHLRLSPALSTPLHFYVSFLMFFAFRIFTLCLCPLIPLFAFRIFLHDQTLFLLYLILSIPVAQSEASSTGVLCPLNASEW